MHTHSTAAGKLLPRLENPKQTKDGWSARCPAHEDRQASLSVSIGDDGRLLVHCHAGCTPAEIVGAVGLSMSDLFVGGDGKPRKATNGKAKCKPRKAGKTYATVGDAGIALQQQLGRASVCWHYHDAHAKHVGTVMRWDRDGGKKDIRPVSLYADGWRCEGMPTPRPLYGLPELLANADDVVVVVEGEKAADAARSIGLLATTSPHGAKSGDKADWSPLAGKQVVLLPDNDDAGAEYAETVAGILKRLTPPATVRFVTLPGLPDKGDIADWVEAQGDAADPEAMRAAIERMAEAADVVTLDVPTPPEPLPTWRPFPTDTLPEPLRSFVVDGAEGIGCDASFVALPLLAALASALGTTRRLQLRSGWTAPAILWTVIVGESGTAKTPAFALALGALRDRQDDAMRRHADAMRDYEIERAEHDRAYAEWKKQKRCNGGDPPVKPTEPTPERCIVSDTTIEALAPLLLANPRGVLVARDELAGWIGSFDRYSGGKGGGDAAAWLSMYSAMSIVVDRKTGIPKTIYVPHAAASVTGGIQPGILARVMTAEHRESGLLARLLVASPPRRRKRWTDASVTPATYAHVASIFDRLLALTHVVDDAGKPKPVVLTMTPEAAAAYKRYWHDHGDDALGMTGDLAAAWSKLEETPARIALVLQLARWAADPDATTNCLTVDDVSMAAGITLARWFGHEARRLYGIMAEGDDDKERRELLDLARRKGGCLTVRDLQRASRRYRTAEDAEAALRGLVDAGCGRWEIRPPGPSGGKPMRVFLAADSVDVDITPENAAKDEVMSTVDSVDKPSTQNEAGDDCPTYRTLKKKAEPSDADDWGYV